MSGLSLGICMTTREFKCLLCGLQFTRMSADLILPETTVCDECLAEMGPLDEVALRGEINRRVAERASPPTQS
jgi:hypothetical protein